MTILVNATPDLSEGSPLLPTPAEPPAVETPTAKPAATAPVAPAAKPAVRPGQLATRIRNGERRAEQESRALAREKAEAETAVRVRTAQLTAHQPTIERAKQIVQLARTDAIGLLRARGYTDEQIQAEILKLAAPPDPRAVAEQRLTRAERALAEERTARQAEKVDATTEKAMRDFQTMVRADAATFPNLAKVPPQVLRDRLEEIVEDAARRGYSLPDDHAIARDIEREAKAYYAAQAAKAPKSAPKARQSAPDPLTTDPDVMKQYTLQVAAAMGRDERAEDAEDEPAEDPLLGRDGKPITREEEIARLDRAIARATQTESPKFRKSKVDGTYRRNSK